MLFLKSVTIVLQINKINTDIVDELKQCYDVLNNITSDKSFPSEYTFSDCHSLLLKLQAIENDNIKFKLVIDGTKGLYCDSIFELFYYSKRNQPSKCPKCGMLGKLNNVLSMPADRPTIIIHVKNNSTDTTTFKAEIASCLNVLVTLKDYITLQQTPIRQVIITKTIESDVLFNTTKIVVDGQTLFDGLSKFEFFDSVENPLCEQCNS